jgi:uncharacterized lipoprotein YmbA
MIKRHLLLAMIIILGVFTVLQWGCVSSPPSRFYLLNSQLPSLAETQPSSGQGCLSLGIGPITMPGYLDQPNIVTRSAANQLMLAGYDLWAEPLKENFTMIISQNLSALLCTKSIVIFPWLGSIPIDYRIEIDVMRFDGERGGKVTLDAWYRILRGDGKALLLARKAGVIEPTEGEDYKALVAAQSRALGQLSHEIAEAIKTLHK